jgi:hypothetical protein
VAAKGIFGKQNELEKAVNPLVFQVTNIKGYYYYTSQDQLAKYLFNLFGSIQDMTNDSPGRFSAIKPIL